MRCLSSRFLRDLTRKLRTYMTLGPPLPSPAARDEKNDRDLTPRRNIIIQRWKKDFIYSGRHVHSHVRPLSYGIREDLYKCTANTHEATPTPRGKPPKWHRHPHLRN